MKTTMATTKHDYTDFDKLMLKLIASGRATAHSLEIDLQQQIKPFVTKTGEEFRVIDRRLQALRKKGVIACGRVRRDTIWRVVEQA